MSEKQRIDEATGTSTVGHEWDGIEELNTPLPRWWLLTFYACVIWGLAYTVMYPAWPMISSATAGMTGWTSRGDLAKEMKAETERRAPILAAISAKPVEQIPGDEKLYATAVEGGRAAFKVHCVQCHGSGAAGSKGYPNLNDDDWIWGGDMATIHQTITHGIRAPEHAETRMSQMPAFGGMFKPAELGSVVAYVQSLSGSRPADAVSAAGAPLFAANCVQCHGPDGKGVRAMGGPNLTDKIWLYGGDEAAIRQTIPKSRYGVMPNWNQKLDATTIKMLAAYVHSLGGGEAAAEAGVAAAAAVPAATPAAEAPASNVK